MFKEKREDTREGPFRDRKGGLVNKKKRTFLQKRGRLRKKEGVEILFEKKVLEKGGTQ